MTQITVATINLRNRADRWRERRHLLVAQLLDAAPDLISLQEISFPIGQGRWLRSQLNARLPEGKRPYQLIQKRKHDLLKGYAEGIGILSNLPVLYHDWVNLGYGGRVALRANIELPSHATLDFVSVHLHHVAQDVETRLEQVLRLTGWLRDVRPVARQIVAGDFNEVPGGLAVQVMKQTFHSAYEELYGREPLATFPTALVANADWAGCLDYIFLSSGIGPVLKAGLCCDKPAENDKTLYPSDHVGVIATVEV